MNTHTSSTGATLAIARIGVYTLYQVIGAIREADIVDTQDVTTVALQYTVYYPTDVFIVRKLMSIVYELSYMVEAVYRSSTDPDSQTTTI